MVPRSAAFLPRFRQAVIACAFLAGTACLARTGYGLDFVVTPAKLTFDRSFEQAQLLVTVSDAAGTTTPRSEDLTTRATYTSSNAAVVEVTAALRQSLGRMETGVSPATKV